MTAGSARAREVAIVQAVKRLRYSPMFAPTPEEKARMWARVRRRLDGEPDVVSWDSPDADPVGDLVRFMTHDQVREQRQGSVDPGTGRSDRPAGRRANQA